MGASAVGWRPACAAWGEPARPGFPRRGNGKGEFKTFQSIRGDRLSLQLEGHFFVATTRWFRIGISTGEVDLNAIKDLSGNVRIDAARLETAPGIGQILAH